VLFERKTKEVLLTSGDVHPHRRYPPGYVGVS
jgi:hypothetical protein